METELSSCTSFFKDSLFNHLVVSASSLDPEEKKKLVLSLLADLDIDTKCDNLSLTQCQFHLKIISKSGKMESCGIYQTELLALISLLIKSGHTIHWQNLLSENEEINERLLTAFEWPSEMLVEKSGGFYSDVPYTIQKRFQTQVLKWVLETYIPDSSSSFLSRLNSELWNYFWKDEAIMSFGTKEDSKEDSYYNQHRPDFEIEEVSVISVADLLGSLNS